MATLRFGITFLAGCLLLVWCTPFVFLMLWTRRIFRIKKNIVHWVSQMFFYGIAYASGVKFKAEGLENFTQGKSYLILSNHISAIDPVVLSCTIPGSFIYTAKESLFRIFYFGWILRSVGNLPIYREDPEKSKDSLIAAQKQIQEGVNSLLIFPEGTRSAIGKMLPFKSGFLRIAKALEEVEILPIVIEGSDRVMFKKELKIRPGLVTIRFLKPILLTKDDFSSKEREIALRDQIQNLMQETYDEMKASALKKSKRRK